VLLTWIVILSAWEMAYRVIGWEKYIFPAPSHVLDSFFDLAGFRTAFGEPLHPGWPRPMEAGAHQGNGIPLLSAPLVSGLRLVIGFIVSVVLGLLLGLSMWRFRLVNGTLGPLFLGLQTLPSVCWVPLAVLIFGLNEIGILFVLVMGSCFAMAISLRDGLNTIPPVYQKAGRMLGASGWRMYRYVLIPASLPAMASSLRQGFSFAWRSLMGAELMFMAVRNHGLGYLLEMGRSFSDIAQVVAVMAIMIALAMLVDRCVFARIEHRVYKRFGLGN
jgi:sulfonate transport system permease protein